MPLTIHSESDYSEAELRLIRELYPNYQILINNVSAPRVYSTIIERLFIENTQGPAVEAMRKVFKAIYTCDPYRRTKEFDKLCQFD